MPASLQDFLYYENLVGSVQQVLGGVPENLLPPAFFAVTDRVEGKTGEYTMAAGTRETARIVAYGSPARQRTMTGVKKVPVSLLHTFESLPADPTVLMQLQSEDSPTRQDMGRQTLARNLADFGTRFRNLRISAVYSALKHGAIYFDREGNLLADSAGAFQSVDFQVPDEHKNQLDITGGVPGGGAIIGASWGTAGTDIIGDVAAIKKAALVRTGYEIVHCFYGPNIPGYILGNTAIGALIHAVPALSQAIANAPNEIPNGLLGLQWHPIQNAFFTDASGGTQSWFTGDEAVFTPEPSADWWGVMEGTYPVPTTLDVVADMLAALGSFTPVQGAFSYATISQNPPGIMHFGGDTFLPLLKNPWAVFLADVVP